MFDYFFENILINNNNNNNNNNPWNKWYKSNGGKDEIWLNYFITSTDFCFAMVLNSLALSYRDGSQKK